MDSKIRQSVRPPVAGAAPPAARDAEQDYHRLLAEGIPAMVWTARPDGHLEYANRRCCEYSGLSADAFRRRGWISLLHADDSAAAAGAWARALKSGSPMETESRLRRHDDAYRRHLTRAEPIRDRVGKVLRWVGCSTDIEDGAARAEGEMRVALQAADAAREAAEAAGRSRDEFLNILSHELRHPLGGILGCVQVLRDVRSGEADRAAAMEALERNTRLQAQVVGDLLDMGRIVTGRLRLYRKVVDVVGIVRAAMESIAPTADAKNIRLAALNDPAAVAVDGDPDRLKRVVVQLLDNAVKFSPPGSKVEVRIRPAGGRVRISVSDNGAGIAADRLPRVFDRFRPPDAPRTRRHGGLGLGLAIVQQVVQLHGGSVIAESAGPGLGATFTISLPMSVEAPAAPAPKAAPAKPSAPARAAAPAETGGGPLAGARLLLVDDAPDARRLLGIMLRHQGAEVVAAGNCAEAVAALERFQPDLLITDIGMPDEDGFSLLRRIRTGQTAGDPELPAVALTGFAGADDRHESLSAGFQAHIGKPVELAELVRILCGLLGREVPETVNL